MTLRFGHQKFYDPPYFSFQKFMTPSIFMTPLDSLGSPLCFIRQENFQEKAGVPAFFGQNSCIFLPFHDVLGLFNKIPAFLLKVILVSASWTPSSTITGNWWESSSCCPNSLFCVAHLTWIEIRVVQSANPFDNHTPSVEDFQKIFHRGGTDFKWSIS